MAQTAEEITVALTGHVYVAPYTTGLVLPSNPFDAPAAAFIDIGYTSEDGVTFSVTPNVEDIMAWQKATPVRRIVTSRDSTIGYTLEQFNRDTFAHAFGGGTWTTIPAAAGPPAVAEHFRYDPPADADALAEYACIIDFEDGARNGRLVMRRGTVNDTVETQLVRNNAAMLPVTLAALTPDGASNAWYFLSDDAAFAV